ARIPIPRNFSIPDLAPRLGLYAILSSIVLYALTYGYYTTGYDKAVYRNINIATDPRGMPNDAGDFRNNLWRKDLFTWEDKRIALVGSSFVRGAGSFVTRDGTGIV